MRKILLPVTTVLFSAIAGNAQIKKGSIFLGGDITAFTQKIEYENGTDVKSKSLGISPLFGKFVKDNLAIGGNVSFLINDTESDVVSDNKTIGYGAGIFARKYKNIGNSGFYLFIQAGLNGGYSNQEIDDLFDVNDVQYKRVFIGVSAYPGISFAVSKKFHLETGFNNLVAATYSSEKRETDLTNNDYKSNSFSLSSSLNNATSSFYLGFRVLISK